jgi:amidohydrolase
MPIINSIAALHSEMTAWRQDLHAHPELSLQEVRTSGIVRAKLAEFGVDEIITGMATHGVVGVIRAGTSERAIGLRADMDALPIREETGLPYASGSPGVMHACGHDGHTTMLLGAAKYLSKTKNFDGTVHFIFQPGEEGHGGGRVMVQQGLFEKFPCDVVFAMHNKPGIPVGNFATKAGPMLAATDRFDITVRGRGTHAAYPHLGTDPFVASAQIVMALQGIVARNVDPTDAAVVTVGFMRGGSAHNVIPDEVQIGGTVRSFRPQTQDMIERRIEEVIRGTAAACGATAEFNYRRGYPPTVNHAAEAEFACDVAAEISGNDKVNRNVSPTMGGEDFSYMLQTVPGAMVWLGNGPGEGGCYLHNAKYDFNDSALPYGVSFFVRLAERFLEKTES